MKLLDNSIWSGVYSQGLVYLSKDESNEGDNEVLHYEYLVKLEFTDIIPNKLSGKVTYFLNSNAESFTALYPKEISENNELLLIEKPYKDNPSEIVENGVIRLLLIDTNTMLFSWYYGEDYFNIPRGHYGGTGILKRVFYN